MTHYNIKQMVWCRPYLYLLGKIRTVYLGLLLDKFDEFPGILMPVLVSHRKIVELKVISMVIVQVTRCSTLHSSTDITLLVFSPKYTSSNTPVKILNTARKTVPVLSTVAWQVKLQVCHSRMSSGEISVTLDGGTETKNPRN